MADKREMIIDLLKRKPTHEELLADTFREQTTPPLLVASNPSRTNKLIGALSDTVKMYDKGISQAGAQPVSELLGLPQSKNALDGLSYGELPDEEGLKGLGNLALTFAGGPLIKGATALGKGTINGLKALRNFKSEY